MEEATRSLIEFVEKASPVIWEAGKREVVSSVVVSTMWLILIGVGLYFLFRVTKKWWDSVEKAYKSDGDKQLILGMSITLFIILLVVMAITLSGMLARIINPDYYAIKYITYLWPG
jgi:hypothetical protein